MILNLFTIKPFDQGYLPEKDGHQVYYQQYGQPNGEPILCFHGGPGGRSKAKHAKRLNLKKYRVILFDQRGCGRSTYQELLSHNTTADLIDDAHRLIQYLKIDSYHLYGESWGSTCALLYAMRHSESISALMLSQIFLARPRDITLPNDSMLPHYPDIAEEFLAPVPSNMSIDEYYAEQMLNGTSEQQAEATRTYGSWEYMMGQLSPKISKEHPDADSIRKYKVFMHYHKHHFFLKENEILDGVSAIENIPTMIVHNRFDYVCPLEGAWALNKALNNSELVIVPDRGHVSDLLYKTARKGFDAFLTSL